MPSTNPELLVPSRCHPELRVPGVAPASLSHPELRVLGIPVDSGNLKFRVTTGIWSTG